MSQLSLSRAFFNDYEGATATITTKHTKFVFFDPKAKTPLADLVQYQAQIGEVEAKNEKSAAGVVNAVVRGYGKPFSVTLAKALSRRFTDDRRNWENRDEQPGSVGPAMKKLIEGAIAGGDVDVMKGIQAGIVALDMPATRESVKLDEAIVASQLDELLPDAPDAPESDESDSDDDGDESDSE